MTCENYEKSTYAHTLSNCTCRVCECWNNGYLALSEKNTKALDEQIHRMKVNMLKERAKEILESGLHDQYDLRFSEMIKKDREKCRLVTISLDDKHHIIDNFVNIDRLEHWVDVYNSKIQKLKFIPKNSWWVYEQRGDCEDDLAKGLHIHLVMPRIKKYPNEIARDISRPLGLEKNYVHVKDSTATICEKYLTSDKSTKKDNKKKARQEMDKLMIERGNLQKIYKKI